jgi:starvation-inducible DNA-binding protein
MKTNIGITDENRKAVSEQLAKLLADEYVLYTKTRNAHWNIEGPDFHSMHLFFESQYEQLDEILDSVAERIRKIGHYAPATLTQFLQLTHLTEKYSLIIKRALTRIVKALFVLSNQIKIRLPT